MVPFSEDAVSSSLKVLRVSSSLKVLSLKDQPAANNSCILGLPQSHHLASHLLHIDFCK